MSQPISLASITPREAAVDALYRCVIGLDSYNKELFESAWAKDKPVFEMFGKPMEGIDVLNADLFEHIGPLVTQHTISNVRLDPKDGADQAYIAAYAVAQHYRPGQGLDPTTPHLMSGSTYHLNVVKDKPDGLWKIKKWSMDVIWLDGDQSVVMPS